MQRISQKFIENITPHQQMIIAVLVILVGVLAILGGYGYYRLAVLSSYIASLEERFATTTVSLEQNIEQTEETLSKVQAERDSLRRQLGDFEGEVNELTLSLSDLERLSRTDPELLQKYSKVYFLNEHYVPPRLVEIPERHKYDEGSDQQVHAEVWPFLEDLLKDVRSSGEEVFIFSSFRSFEEQSALKGQYTITYGEGANQFSADQGYSEHQLGTTVDLITTGIDGTLEGFENTDAYEWLLENAHKYGFTLSYPPDNEFYIFEPWHWRFVGVELASKLKKTNRHFYDLDQREIDEFMISLFD